MNDARDRPQILGPDSITGEQPLAGDASTRRYTRGRGPNELSVVVCRYPPEDTGRMARDLEVFAWLHRQGIPVPSILGANPERGWAAFEDLGPLGGASWLRAAPPGERPRRAEQLLGPLVTLQGITATSLPGGHPPLDESHLRWELTGFELWLMAWGSGPRPTSMVSTYLDDLASRVGTHPPRPCHRDYHLDNLIIDPLGAVRVIDAQDLRLGPDTYDLASFLYERAAPDLLSRQHSEHVASAWASSVAGEPGWPNRLRECRLQRGLKVLGTFSRLAVTRSPEYGGWIGPLAADLAPLVRGDGAPSELVELLLDLGAAGGNHARELWIR